MTNQHGTSCTQPLNDSGFTSIAPSEKHKTALGRVVFVIGEIVVFDQERNAVEWAKSCAVGTCRVQSPGD
ncbi:hypothetical protein Tdes44962_MAKER03001 [Teratosphaeria destructans]|uniref:Uncharacterized protein n=1 Tax=Teratosphaeria destructans TaxID=418781 RepID=A0A9W7SR17_9PEZI|nr:hypothetical protein Tdes44962_MAKER03001 [Teratosphaeria destructans]